jgi:hypothetical protein
MILSGLVDSLSGEAKVSVSGSDTMKICDSRKSFLSPFKKMFNLLSCHPLCQQVKICVKVNYLLYYCWLILIL